MAVTPGETRDTLEEWQAGAGKRYVFHYTDAHSAEVLLSGEDFIVEDRAQYGFGMYATDIPPVNAQTLGDVSTQAFQGDAKPPEIHWVLVLRIQPVPDYEFVQTEDPYQWLIERPAPGHHVEIDALIEGAARWDGRKWELVPID